MALECPRQSEAPVFEALGPKSSLISKSGILSQPDAEHARGIYRLYFISISGRGAEGYRILEEHGRWRWNGSFM
jgi:hypothetical protein